MNCSDSERTPRTVVLRVGQTKGWSIAFESTGEQQFDSWVRLIVECCVQCDAPIRSDVPLEVSYCITLALALLCYCVHLITLEHELTVLH
jgi:hypothetical protein